MTEIVLPSDASGDGCLLAGPLLKWIDICACMSAERFSRVNCVTISMDDVHFLRKAKVGEVVKLVARVHQAWKTSMEVGVVVTLEHLGESGGPSGETQLMCRAIATFVAKDKRALPVLNLSTAEERELAEGAGARRAIRLKAPKPSGKDLSPGAEVPETVSTEMVMPHHCQHMGTTFGGWVMHWMESTASIAAARFTRQSMLCASTDTVLFMSPSRAGEALELRAHVTATYGTSLEVVALAFAENLRSGERREVCRLYASYALAELEGHVPIPALPVDEEALQRRRSRLQRKAIQAPIDIAVDAVAFGQKAARAAVGELLALAQKDDMFVCQQTNWMMIFDGAAAGVPMSLEAMEGHDITCLRIQCTLGISAEKLHEVVNDMESRKKWDHVLEDMHVLPSADGLHVEKLLDGGESADGLHVDFSQLKMKGGHDAILARVMTFDEKTGAYVSVYRSVRHPNEPGPPVGDRVQVLPSGWVLRPHDGECSATYSLQLGARALKMMLMKMDGSMMSSAAELQAALAEQGQGGGGGAANIGMLPATMMNFKRLLQQFPPKAVGIA